MPGKHDGIIFYATGSSVKTLHYRREKNVALGRTEVGWEDGEKKQKKKRD